MRSIASFWHCTSELDISAIFSKVVVLWRLPTTNQSRMPFQKLLNPGQQDNSGIFHSSRSLPLTYGTSPAKQMWYLMPYQERVSARYSMAWTTQRWQQTNLPIGKLRLKSLYRNSHSLVCLQNFSILLSQVNSKTSVCLMESR